MARALLLHLVAKIAMRIMKNNVSSLVGYHCICSMIKREGYLFNHPASKKKVFMEKILLSAKIDVIGRCGINNTAAGSQRILISKSL